MKNFSQLISTNLTPPFKKSKKYYLGDWCNHNLNDDFDFKNIWDTKKKRNNDHKYLKKLFKRVIDSLSIELNNYHKKNFTKYFWKFLIWIWLCHYLNSNYFKWKSSAINLKNKKKKLIFYYNSYNNICPKDSLSHLKYSQDSDFYNEYCFSNILQNFKGLTIKKNKKINFTPNKKNLRSQKNIFNFTKILKKICNFISLRTNKKKFVINGTFSLKNLILLCFKIKSFPIFIDEILEDKTIQLTTLNKKDIEKRKLIKIKIKAHNDFEKYIKKSIKYEIPSFFIEDFKKNYLKIKKNIFDCNLIISSVDHYYSDLYKLWISLHKINPKTKFYAVEHGGNHSSYNWDYDYEKNISDKFLSWNTNKKNFFSFPKLIGYKIKSSKRKKLLYVGFENDKYMVKINEGPKSFNKLSSITNLSKFSASLDIKILNELIYCEKDIRDNRLKKKIEHIISKNKFKKKGSFKKELRNAKLVVCDYPQTTYLESLVSRPTILLFDSKKFWSPNKNLKNIYYLLKKNQMLFDDPINAVKFINHNWSDIDLWWNSKKIRKIRKIIIDKFKIETKYDSLDSWSKFIINNL